MKIRWDSIAVFIGRNARPERRYPPATAGTMLAASTARRMILSWDSAASSGSMLRPICTSAPPPPDTVTGKT